MKKKKFNHKKALTSISIMVLPPVILVGALDLFGYLFGDTGVAGYITALGILGILIITLVYVEEGRS